MPPRSLPVAERPLHVPLGVVPLFAESGDDPLRDLLVADGAEGVLAALLHAAARPRADDAGLVVEAAAMEPRVLPRAGQSEEVAPCRGRGDRLVRPLVDLAPEHDVGGAQIVGSASPQVDLLADRLFAVFVGEPREAVAELVDHGLREAAIGGGDDA